MPQITLRKTAGVAGPDDIIVSVQDRTFDYLMSSDAEEIRVSAYLEQDLPRVDSNYAELFVANDCPFSSSIAQITPGSRTRKVQLPGEMKAGEQLVVLVKRSSLGHE
jgi:hypothetical protein